MIVFGGLLVILSLPLLIGSFLRPKGAAPSMWPRLGWVMLGVGVIISGLSLFVK